MAYGPWRGTMCANSTIPLRPWCTGPWRGATRAVGLNSNAFGVLALGAELPVPAALNSNAVGVLALERSTTSAAGTNLHRRNVRTCHGQRVRQ